MKSGLEGGGTPVIDDVIKLKKPYLFLNFKSNNQRQAINLVGLSNIENPRAHYFAKTRIKLCWLRPREARNQKSSLRHA